MPDGARRSGVRWCVLAVMLWPLLAAAPAHATRVPPMSVEELFARSGAVYVGTVEAVETPCRERPPPCTRVTFADLEVIAGEIAAQELSFALPEGPLEDGTVFRIVGAPMFRVGERYLVFVRAGDWFNTPVTNWFRGVFRQVRLPDQRFPPFFVNHEGRAILGVDGAGFQLGERVAPPEDALSGPSPGLLQTRPALALSSGGPTSDAVREVLAGRRDFAALAMPEDELVERLRALAQTYGLRGNAPVRLEPAASPTSGDQESTTAKGLDRAATEPRVPRYRDEEAPPAEPQVPPEPPVRRSSHPGQSLGD